MKRIVTSKRTDGHAKRTALRALGLAALLAALVALLLTRRDSDESLTLEASHGRFPAVDPPRSVSATHVVQPHSVDAANRELRAQVPPLQHLKPANGEKNTLHGNVATSRVVRVSTRTVVPGNVIERREAMFDNHVENFLLRYVESPSSPVMLMQRFDKDSDEDIRQILSSDVKIYDDEDEAAVSGKEAVAALKQEVLMALADGYSAADVLNAMRNDNNARVMRRVAMQRRFNSLVRSNLVEEAKTFLAEANEQLAEAFMPPLDTGDGQF